MPGPFTDELVRAPSESAGLAATPPTYEISQFTFH